MQRVVLIQNGRRRLQWHGIGEGFAVLKQRGALNCSVQIFEQTLRRSRSFRRAGRVHEDTQHPNPWAQTTAACLVIATPLGYCGECENAAFSLSAAADSREAAVCAILRMFRKRGRPVSTWVAKLQGRTEVHESSLNSFANYSCQRRQLRSGRLTRPNLRPAGACATEPGGRVHRIALHRATGCSVKRHRGWPSVFPAARVARSEKTKRQLRT